MTTMNTPAPPEGGPQGSLTPQPSPIAIHLAQALIEKYPQITYGISVPSSVPEDRKSTNAYQAVIIGGFLQGKCAGLAVNNYVTLEHKLAQSEERVAKAGDLASAWSEYASISDDIAKAATARMCANQLRALLSSSKTN